MSAESDFAFVQNKIEMTDSFYVRVLMNMNYCINHPNKRIKIATPNQLELVRRVRQTLTGMGEDRHIPHLKMKWHHLGIVMWYDG